MPAKYRKRALLLIIVAIVAGSLAIVAYVRISAKAERASRPAQSNAITVGTSVLRAETIDQVLNFQGILEGNPQIKVYPKVNGKLNSLAVREGQTVGADQTLLLINRDLAGYDFQLAPVKSPVQGIVTRLYFTDIGTEMSPDKPAAEVANPYRVKLSLNVGEQDLLAIKTGQPAELWSLKDPSLRVLAYVDSVTPFVDRDSLTGGVTLKAENPNLVLKIGMSCGVSIKTGSHRGFMVDEESVILGLGQASVYRYDNGVARQIPVTLGYNHEGRLEIKGKLNDGDILINEGAFKVYDNANVQLAPAAGTGNKP